MKTKEKPKYVYIIIDFYGATNGCYDSHKKAKEKQGAFDIIIKRKIQ